MFWTFLILIGGVILDQAVKWLSVEYLKPIGELPIIKDVLYLQYCENTGAAFSMLSGQRIFLIFLPVVIISVALFFLLSGRIRGICPKVAVSMIVTGGFSNLIDRIFNGYVVDMFDFRFINFAVFNVADIFVTCGAIFFAAVIIFSREEVFVWKRSSSDKSPQDSE